MKITTRPVISFLTVSILPLVVLSVASLEATEQASSLALEQSTAALNRLGETAIRQRAEDVAAQMGLYLAAHPDRLEWPAARLEGDADLAAIAVQPVGETGYTAVFDSAAITHFHVNPNIIGNDMHSLAESLPDFRAIMEASLEGKASCGYYAWQNGDGVIRDKYMCCVPVTGTPLRVAATTYIDEFHRPVRETAAQIAAITRQTRGWLVAAVILVGLLALGVALRLAWSISRPTVHLIQAAVALEQGTYRSEHLAVETSRRDDLGRLARVFDRVARQVEARESELRSQIRQLRIEIDEAKRARQVAAITETEQFRELQSRVRQMRRGASPAEETQEA